MSTASMPQPVGESERRHLNLSGLLARFGPILVLVVMIVVFGAMRPKTFLDWDNFINVLNLSALGAIIAMGLTFVLVTGDFDLSVGYVASLGGVLTAWLTAKHGWPLGAAIVFAIAAAALVGYLNGLLVTVVGINALIATLGVGTIVLGLNFAITTGVPVNVSNPTLLGFTFHRLWGIPHPVYVMIGVAVVLWVLLNKTASGYAMQAVGGNRVAAEYSGIRVARIRRISFVIAAACAGLTGVLLTSQSGAATVDGGQSFLLPAFAAAFFGSAVLKEGQFHVIGTLLGIFTVQVGFNGITLIGIESYYQYIFQGSLLIFAVGAGARMRLSAAR
jgi:ribose transport system permease protein